MTGSIHHQVNAHSRLTVVSSTPIEPMGQTYPLTPTDHTMSSHTVHIIYYYRTRPFSNQGRYAMDLDNVRVSLSELLSKYPRMTGRLVRDVNGNWEVKYNDAGIRMLKANVATTVDEWLRFADEVDERNLTVWEDMPDGDPTSWSPFQIQVNEFVGGGLAIGISFSHMLADPTSGVLFYKSWTDSERGDPAGRHPPIFTLPPLNNHPPPTSTENTPITIKYMQKHSKQPPVSSPKMATSTFKFSSTTIKQGLSKITDKCPEATPFDYLTAVFWMQIIKLKTLIANSPTHSISLCLDTRKHLNVPIPTKFFGNALTFSQMWLENNTIVSDNALAEVVLSVHQHVNGIKKDDIVSMIDWLESSPEGLNGVYPKGVQMYGPELTCVSLEHLIMSPKDECESLVYEARFRNNEKPMHVSFNIGKAEGAGLIVVAPCLEGGMARTVTVTLPGEEVRKLCEDPVIMGMAPTMILSGGLQVAKHVGNV